MCLLFLSRNIEERNGPGQPCCARPAPLLVRSMASAHCTAELLRLLRQEMPLTILLDMLEVWARS